MTVEEYKATFRNRETKIYKVFAVLENKAWHCRKCEYKHVGSIQIAGGGGFQGLERGNQRRPGLRIESENRRCNMCERKTRQDRWTGHFVDATRGRAMPKNVARRVFRLLGKMDVIDQVERSLNELTVDHKLPTLRWTKEEAARQSNYANLSDNDIRDRFQLLKCSNGNVSDNLLKSRACERCYETGKRGAPMGITYFYAGGPEWAPANKKDPGGCFGCGWYDVAAWRDSLNAELTNKYS